MSNSFSECIKVLQEKCDHKEVETLKNGVTICMCCGKVIIFTNKDTIDDETIG